MTQTIVEQVQAMSACPYGGGENLWRTPSRPKFNANSYPARVRFAAWAICEGDHSRQHDTCFEMYDGAAVVVALMRAASSGKADYLAHRLEHACLTPTGWANWQATVAQYSEWPDAKLPDLAASIRASARQAQTDQAALPL